MQATLPPEHQAELDRFRTALELEDGFAFHLIVVDRDLDISDLLHRLPVERLLQPKPPIEATVDGAAGVILDQLERALSESTGRPLWVDARAPQDRAAWGLVFGRLNERRNGIEKQLQAPLVILVTPGGETLLGHRAPDLWSRRGSGMRLKVPADAAAYSRDIGRSEPELPPPRRKRDFEAFCFDLFRHVWQDPGAQSVIYPAAAEARINIFGRSTEGRVGVQCRLAPSPGRPFLSAKDLRQAVERVQRVKPALDHFIIATSGPREPEAQALAHRLSNDDLKVSIWTWPDLWDLMESDRDRALRLIPLLREYAQHRVFISYSHDGPNHKDKVLALAQDLRRDGLDVSLDRFVVGGPEQGWARWVLDELDRADFVLVVCSEGYYRRFRGFDKHQDGDRAGWGGALITQELYDASSRNKKFVPILLSAEDRDFVPEPLRPFTRYTLTSAAAYEELYRYLTGQPAVEPAPLGKTRPLPSRGIDSLSFDAGPEKSPLGAAGDGGGGQKAIGERSPEAAEHGALGVWRQKLNYLQTQEPITVDPDAKFRLRALIDEAEQKIRELKDPT